MAEFDITTPVESPGAYFPQDFSIKTLNFLTASGQRIELKKLLMEMSIYEDIYSFVISGYIKLKDAQGFPELMQLTGNEFIEVNFSKIKDDVNAEDKVFRVYKLGDRKPTGNMNSEVYTLYFCSEDLVLSEQIKISKSYSGQKISSIVENILTDQLLIDPKRLNKIEETTGVYNFVVPRLKPFEAISWVSLYARPGAGEVGADMLFFENSNGYNFRSLQSMFKEDVYGTYKYQAKNLGDDVQSFEEKASSVLEYEFVKTYDSLNDINAGTYANRLVSLDPIARTAKVTDFSYEDYKKNAISLNDGNATNKLTNRLGINQERSFDASFKVAIGNSLQADAPYIKQAPGSVAKDIAIETYVPNRTAQIALANYTVIKATIPGDPGITVGRTIDFNLYTLKPTDVAKDLDRFYSGKYLVTAVRHIIQSQGVYQTLLEIAKDSSPTSATAINQNNSDWKESVKQ